MTDTSITQEANVSIHHRAMLVDLTMRFWTARKLDRKVTQEVLAAHGAGDEAGRFNKNLLGGKWPSHDKLRQADGRIRRLFAELTLPWQDGGIRLLPSAEFMEFTEKLRAAIAQYETCRAEFAEDYRDNIRPRAKELLNSMYDAADYPTDVAGKFGVEVTYLPVPASGDFRLDLPADELLRAQESVEQHVQRATQRAVQDVWDRLYEMVREIHDKFAKSLEPRGEDERAYNVRQGLMDKARDMVDLLGRLNIADDPKLEELRQQVLQELTVKDADVLRDDTTKRTATKDKAKAIMKKMEGVYGGPQQQAA